MIGILSYGAYIPMWRIDRSIIAHASSTGSMGGERSVASWDEDSLTMAVEAGVDCLKGFDPKDVDGLYFATISPPFKLKQASSIIASALDLRNDVVTCDFGFSMRSGTAAIRAAVDAVTAGNSKSILVIAADRNKSMQGSEFEQIDGDGAAAILVGTAGMIAEVEGFTTISNPIPGRWQREKDDYPRSFEPKLDRSFGILKDIPAAVNSLLRKYNLALKDISKFALYGSDPRIYRNLTNKMKIDPKVQTVDSLFSMVGITGTPHALLLLVSALEKAKKDERIICASYGDGGDAFLIKTTGEIEAIKGKHRGTEYISSKRMINSYSRFADFQGTRNTGWPPKHSKASVVKYWREEKWNLPFYGMKCKKCGTLQYPIRRCCSICGEKDNNEERKLASKGQVFTYTHDYLTGPGIIPGDGINPCTRVCADMEDGCRLWLEMSDNAIDEIKFGMPVELTFRLFHEKDGFRYYSWRGRPLRE